jgi:hypothetical protein
MDIAGKIVYARNSEILTATLQVAGASPVSRAHTRRLLTRSM